MTHPDPPPPLLLFIIVGLSSIMAQAGSSLAFGLTKDRMRLLGYLLLSPFLSCAVMLLLAQNTGWDDYTCAAIGVLVGAVPALWTVLLGIRIIGKRFGLNITEMIGTPPNVPPPATPSNSIPKGDAKS